MGVCALGACRSQGLATAGARDLQDGCGGHASFAEKDGVLVGAGEDQRAQGLECFALREDEKGVEICGDRGHGRTMARVARGSRGERRTCRRCAHSVGRCAEVCGRSGEMRVRSPRRASSLGAAAGRGTPSKSLVSGRSLGRSVALQVNRFTNPCFAPFPSHLARVAQMLSRVRFPVDPTPFPADDVKVYIGPFPFDPRAPRGLILMSPD